MKNEKKKWCSSFRMRSYFYSIYSRIFLYSVFFLLIILFTHSCYILYMCVCMCLSHSLSVLSVCVHLPMCIVVFWYLSYNFVWLLHFRDEQFFIVAVCTFFFLILKFCWHAKIRIWNYFFMFIVVLCCCSNRIVY